MSWHAFEGYGDRELTLAMLGMVDGNGHPYSWSAIFNGYDPAGMARCPYPTIPDYLGKEPQDSVQIPGARVTHVWTDDPADAEQVVERPAMFVPRSMTPQLARRNAVCPATPTTLRAPAARPPMQRLSSARRRRGTESSRAAPILAPPTMAEGRSPR